jgi:hypothetical protein
LNSGTPEALSYQFDVDEQSVAQTFKLRPISIQANPKQTYPELVV